MIERVMRDEVSLSEAIRYYRAEGNPAELVEAARNSDCRSNFLYILAEIGDKTRAVWKDTIEFLTDDHDRTVYWALDIIHAFCGKDDCEPLLEVLDSVDLDKPVLFAKTVSILRSIEAECIELMLKSSIRMRGWEKHQLGLYILQFPDSVTDEARSLFLEDQTPTVCLYISAWITRFHPNDASLVSRLPGFVQEDLQVDNSPTK